MVWGRRVKGVNALFIIKGVLGLLGGLGKARAQETKKGWVGKGFGLDLDFGD